MGKSEVPAIQPFPETHALREKHPKEAAQATGVQPSPETQVVREKSKKCREVQDQHSAHQQKLEDQLDCRETFATSLPVSHCTRDVQSEIKKTQDADQAMLVSCPG